jgi:hypothetical protein
LQSAGYCAWLFICECGANSCRVEVELTLDEFDSLRAAERWLLAPGHRFIALDASPEEADRLTAEAAALTAHAADVASYQWREMRFRP